jgi:hypothetical protein
MSYFSHHVKSRRASPLTSPDINNRVRGDHRERSPTEFPLYWEEDLESMVGFSMLSPMWLSEHEVVISRRLAARERGYGGVAAAQRVL